MSKTVTDTIPEDLKRLVALSSSWRKILLIVAIPLLLIGAVLLIQLEVLAAIGCLGVGALFAYLALKPKDASKSKVVRLLAQQPAEVTRISVVEQSGFGAKSSQVHVFADSERLPGILLVDDVRNLEEALAIIQRYAPQASVDHEHTRVRVG